ncbi:MAG: hypothetical protein ACYTEL_17930 [Planctomycetota bacterium]|jgi:hypothetical protein
MWLFEKAWWMVSSEHYSVKQQMKDKTRKHHDLAKMPKDKTEVEGNKIRTEKANWPFWVTATTVCIFNLIIWRMGKQGPGFPSPGFFILCGILGLVALNCVAFIIPLLSALKDIGKVDKKKLTDEQKEKEVERIMVPAFDGRKDPPRRTADVIRFLFWVCVGLIVGSAAAWVIYRVIEFNVAKFKT